MKIYTRTGDEGQTGLFSGERVVKSDLRVKAYGTVDELNSTIGWCLAALTPESPIAALLIAVQSRLFEVGADLATLYRADEDVSKRYVPRLDPNAVDELESAIDQAAAATPELKTFILPGGAEAACRLHIARTVCRRAERETVELAQHTNVNADLVIYLNRLSDCLFAVARQVNAEQGVEDVPWVSGRVDPKE